MKIDLKALIYAFFFSTVEAFNAVDSAKPFNLGAPVKKISLTQLIN